MNLGHQVNSHQGIPGLADLPYIAHSLLESGQSLNIDGLCFLWSNGWTDPDRLTQPCRARSVRREQVYCGRAGGNLTQMNSHRWEKARQKLGEREKKKRERKKTERLVDAWFNLNEHPIVPNGTVGIDVWLLCNTVVPYRVFTAPLYRSWRCILNLRWVYLISFDYLIMQLIYFSTKSSATLTKPCINREALCKCLCRRT